MKISKFGLIRRISILIFAFIFTILGLILINNKFNFSPEVNRLIGKATAALPGSPLLIPGKFCDNPTDPAQAKCKSFFSSVLAANPSIYQSVDADVAIAGNLTSSTYKVAGTVGTAKQSADLTATGQVWKDLPGVIVRFNLPIAKTVNMRAFGSVTGDGGTEIYTHCGFRFVIDEEPYGQPSWGDQIISVNRKTPTDDKDEGTMGAPGWWTAWHIERDQDLEAGSHTITMQMTGWSKSDVGCKSRGMPKNNTTNIKDNGLDYSAARLWVEAR